jgi:predicted DNA-binding WGR domain protein
MESLPLPFRPIELVAIDTTRNVRRHWSIVAYRDLFDHLIVETGWGRIGRKSRSLVRCFEGENEARRYVHALLKQRESAHRRIGVAYTEAAAC